MLHMVTKRYRRCPNKNNFTFRFAAHFTILDNHCLSILLRAINLVSMCLCLYVFVLVYFLPALLPRTFRAAAVTSCSRGSAFNSKDFVYGMGTSTPQQRQTGASSSKNAWSSIKRAQISAPTPA